MLQRSSTWRALDLVAGSAVTWLGWVVQNQVMTALHVFDMDGTLLRGATASQRMATVHGSEAELQTLKNGSPRATLVLASSR